MIAKTMVFRPGNSIVIWGINLDIAEVDEHEVPDYLADGWYSHPFEARDAEDAAREQAIADKQAELEANAKALADAEAKAQADQKAAQEAEAKAKADQDEKDKAAAADTELALKTKLAEEAIGLGITVDGRWSSTRLQKEIEAKKAQ